MLDIKPKQVDTKKRMSVQMIQEKTGCKLIPETTFKRGYNE